MEQETGLMRPAFVVNGRRGRSVEAAAIPDQVALSAGIADGRGLEGCEGVRGAIPVHGIDSP